MSERQRMTATERDVLIWTAKPTDEQREAAEWDG